MLIKKMTIRDNYITEYKIQTKHKIRETRKDKKEQQ